MHQQPTNNARMMNYMFVVGNKDKVTYAAAAGMIPGVHLGEAVVPSRFSDEISIPSNKISFDDLILPIYVSDDYREWLELYQWMINCRDTSDIEYDRHLETCELFILDQQNRHVVSFLYDDCYPSDIDAVNLSIMGDTNDVVTANVTFKHRSMRVKLGNGEVIDEATTQGNYNHI